MNMETKFSERMLEVKIESSRNKLMSRIKSLKDNLDYTLEMLEKDENYKPNSLGIIQSSGVEIDVLCSKLSTLYEMKELLEADKNN